jgi:hypothetical protein
MTSVDRAIGFDQLADRSRGNHRGGMVGARIETLTLTIYYPFTYLTQPREISVSRRPS